MDFLNFFLDFLHFHKQIRVVKACELTIQIENFTVNHVHTHFHTGCGVDRMGKRGVQGL